MSSKQSISIAYFGMFILLGMLLASTGPLLPFLAKQVNSSLSEISILFMVASLGRLLGALLGGRLLDRLKGHPLMAFMLFLSAFCLISIPSAKLLWVLAAIYLGFGLVQAIVDVGANTLIIWVHKDKVAPYMNTLHLCFGLGAFLIPLVIARAIALTGSTTWVFWILASLCLPVIIWLLSLSSPRSPEKDASQDVLPANPKLVWLLAIFFFFYVSVEVGFSGWIFSYALESGLANEQTAAYLTSGFFATYTLGRLLAIFVAARVAPKIILLTDLAIAVVSLIIMLLFHDSLIMIWVGTLLLGLAMASVFPTALAFAERRMNVTGKVTSYFFIGGSLGGIITPWLIGQLFERIGPNVVLSTNLIMVCLAFLGIWFITVYSQKQMLRAAS